MATLSFCQECNNILSPKADPARRIMMLWCRSCGAEEGAHNRCVYKNDLLTVTKEQAGVTHDLGTDPTLPHQEIICPSCNHNDSVFYQDQSKRTETRMILFYVCVKCGHSFLDPSLKRRGDIEGLGDDDAMAT
ncbi:hypothetical protein BOTBODRAFT_63340 [Botryobasidium botryosum FD-172 SS1]|uniref:DNA-directed RNA polymerase subunit n=1 Tax=Botryobasidium botryosum (strain FD-172 SS1) TaxID=930990 RepID=A0A067N3M2_BOTB1|nr:hypothetical protein BOTBODRAFT_63340 [Botryobasidium botryosum FD-172 SS1]